LGLGLPARARRGRAWGAENMTNPVAASARHDRWSASLNLAERPGDATIAAARRSRRHHHHRSKVVISFCCPWDLRSTMPSHRRACNAGSVNDHAKLRCCAKCTKCGHKRTTIQHPGWGGADVGFCRSRSAGSRARPLTEAARNESPALGGA